MTDNITALRSGKVECDYCGKSVSRRNMARHRGLCKGIPLGTVEDRFWAKVLPTGFCWEWTARTGRKGYGLFTERMGGPSEGAHRVAYRLLVGEVAQDAVLDHLCRNPICVNPDHLEPVTNAENILRGFSPSAVLARRTHCKWGHEFTEENTHVTRNGSRKCRTCDREASRRKRQRRILTRALTEGAADV